jgi:hypothetical protein
VKGPKERWLFVGLLLLHLAPIWTVRFVPTTDGPCHNYNAWILLHHDDPAWPRFQEHYEIDRRPLPNWLSHAALALLMLAFPPAIAEKIVASACIALLPLAVRRLATAVDPERRWLSWLAFPFTYHVLFQYGFYNFSIGLSLHLFAMATWWRHRDRPTAAYAVGINLLLLLAYFCHILSVGFALLSIAVLMLTTLRRDRLRTYAIHAAILAPQALLPLWFVHAERGAPPVPSRWSTWFELKYLFRLEALYTFDEIQLLLGIAVITVSLLLALWTLVSRARRDGRLRAEEDGFLLLAVLFAAAFFVSPDGLSGGTMLQQRLSLYPWLLLIPWLAPPPTPPLRATLAGALALAAAAHAGLLVHRYRQTDREVGELIAAADAMAPHTRVAPLLFDRDPEHSRLGLMGHAIDRVALEKGLIDWDNYEAASRLFPVRFRPEVEPPDIYILEAAPGFFNARSWRARAEYVFVWKAPPDVKLGARLRRFYRLDAKSDNARLFRKVAHPAGGLRRQGAPFVAE